VKAFLLAAGEGRRLRPLTDTIPKCLVPIRGTPLLALWLQLLERDGVTDVLVNVHHAPEQVTGFIDSYRTPMSIATVYEERLLGSAGTVLANRNFVGDESSFVIAYADNLTNVNLHRMIQFHGQRQDAITIGVVPTDIPTQKGTVLIGPDGRVLQFAEKAPRPPSNLANAGIYVANQELFAYLDRRVPSSGVLDFGYDVLPDMVPNVAAYEIEEFLMDIGTPEDYEVGQREWPGL
jgi:mannose-1-phosphate guanylyltransferase